MTGYVSVKLRRLVREHFSNRCAYCQTAESLTVSIFEIEHVVFISKRASCFRELVPSLSNLQSLQIESHRSAT